MDPYVPGSAEVGKRLEVGRPLLFSFMSLVLVLIAAGEERLSFEEIEDARHIQAGHDVIDGRLKSLAQEDNEIGLGHGADLICRQLEVMGLNPRGSQIIDVYEAATDAFHRKDERIERGDDRDGAV